MNLVVNKKVKLIDLGLIDYKKAWDYQEDIFKQVVEVKIANRKKPDEEQLPTPNYLIFCEHPHVYTLGKSGKEENLLLNDTSLLLKGESVIVLTTVLSSPKCSGKVATTATFSGWFPRL